jgi:hypothetical protein
LLAERLDDSTRFGRIIGTWVGPAIRDALALRAAGALHGLARSGHAPGLAQQYPPRSSGEVEALWKAVAAALPAHEDFLCEYLQRPPQTNEVGRSSVLLGAALIISQRTGLALRWNEVGASAGLNLAFDHYRYDLGSLLYGDPNSPVLIRSDWQGNLPALSAQVRLAERAGADIEPLCVDSSDDRERLVSYVWPDQSERLARTATALDMLAATAWRVQRAAAAEWVASRFSPPFGEEQVHVLAHTVVWQYLSQNERNAITGVMSEAGSRATARSQVAWFSMEADDVRDGACLQLTLWPGGQRTVIGRADFHGRWVKWL